MLACVLSLMFSLSLCLCVCLCFFLSRVCSVSLFLTLSLPKIYWAETQNWKGKGTFSCQGWEMCSWHSKQNWERIYFFIETLMKMVIETHQVGRVSVKTTSSEARETPGSWFYYAQTVCPWANYPTYLSSGSLWHEVLLRIKPMR